jgi:hypothetical protein
MALCNKTVLSLEHGKITSTHISSPTLPTFTFSLKSMEFYMERKHRETRVSSYSHRARSSNY